MGRELGVGSWELCFVRSKVVKDHNVRLEGTSTVRYKEKFSCRPRIGRQSLSYECGIALTLNRVKRSHQAVKDGASCGGALNSRYTQPYVLLRL
jgi:hypothetical protein